LTNLDFINNQSAGLFKVLETLYKFINLRGAMKLFENSGAYEPFCAIKPSSPNTGGYSKTFAKKHF
jgi:hypothetical protein